MHTIRNKQGGSTDTDFWNKWSSVNPRMAMFVKITPKPFFTGVDPIGFTSNTRDMTLPGHGALVFKSAVGIAPSAIEQALENPTTFEVQGLYQSGLFEQDDVVRGKWDFATVEIFAACWDNTNLGELVLFKGNMGEFKDYQLYFTAEGRGLISRLSSDAGEVTTRYCRVKVFRDSQCGHTASTVTIDGDTYDIQYTSLLAVGTTVSTRQTIYVPETYWTGQLTPKLVPPNGYFNNGTITSTSGANEGLSREILKSSTNNIDVKFALKRPFPFAVAVSDEFTVTAGCNRTVEDCRKYGNIINFRGEPYIPGLENANRVPTSS